MRIETQIYLQITRLNTSHVHAASFDARTEVCKPILAKQRDPLVKLPRDAAPDLHT